MRLISMETEVVAEKLRALRVPANKTLLICISTLDNRFVLPDQAAFGGPLTARATITPFTLISVAVITVQKGYHETLDVVAVYRERADARPLRIVFVGCGPKLEAMQEYAIRLELIDVVHSEGTSYHVDLPLDRAHEISNLPEIETFIKFPGRVTK